MATYAVLDDAGNIVNRIVLEDPADWSIPEGQSIVAEKGAALEIGGTYTKGVYSPPPRAEAELPPAQITKVTPRQARLALYGVGLLSQVNAAIAAADEPTQITWEFASEIDRNDQLVIALAAALGLSNKQVDALFAQAATL